MWHLVLCMSWIASHKESDFCGYQLLGGGGGGGGAFSAHVMTILAVAVLEILVIYPGCVQG